MIEVINRKGWTIANGNLDGDEEGKVTFMEAKGSTVIDYVIVNERIKKKIGTFKVVNRIESDHVPLSLTIWKERTRQRREEESKKEKNE